MAALYDWTAFPSGGTANFETVARATLEEWRSSAESLDSAVQDYNPATVATTGDVIALAIALGG